MKLIIVLVIVVVTAVLVFVDFRHGVAPQETAAPQALLAPALELPALHSDETVSLAAYRGRYVLLNGWASWCTPCLAEFPDLLRLADAHPDRLTLLTVSADRDQTAAQDFLKRFGELPDNVAHAWDQNGSRMRELLHIYRYPESILIAPDGQMVEKFAGALTPAQLKTIRAQLADSDKPAQEGDAVEQPSAEEAGDAHEADPEE